MSAERSAKSKMDKMVMELTKLFSKKFHSSINTLPKYPIDEVSGPTIRGTVKPDKKYQIISREGLYSMTTFSTYAVIKGKKTGDPICDKAAIRLYDNCAIVVMCDGCGWGMKSLRASCKATDGSMKYITDNISQCKTIRDVGAMLVFSAIAAHVNIISGEESVLNCGQTTFHVDVVVKCGDEYYAVYINIGDCRTYRYSPSTHQTVSLCGKSHVTSSEVHDCFSRLGPCNSYEPELRIYELGYSKVEENDLLLVMTDGFQDNFNPIFFGNYFNGRKIDTCGLFTELIEKGASLTDIVELLSDHVVNLTEANRQLVSMTGRQKDDFDPNCPGKLDHSTICVLRITDFSSMLSTEVNELIPNFNRKLLPDDGTYQHFSGSFVKSCVLNRMPQKTCIISNSRNNSSNRCIEVKLTKPLNSLCNEKIFQRGRMYGRSSSVGLFTQEEDPGNNDLVPDVKKSANHGVINDRKMFSMRQSKTPVLSRSTSGCSVSKSSSPNSVMRSFTMVHQIEMTSSTPNEHFYMGKVKRNSVFVESFESSMSQDTE